MENKDNTCITPIEEQRKRALEHYNELATKCCDWSSFVQRAIESYNPSSNKDKEAILNMVYEGKLYSCPGDDEIREAMESYSASQNEELRKENEGLNRVISKLFADKVEETRQLQSTIDELEKAFENNKEQLMELATHARDLESTIDEKNKEIERLNGLIEDAHNSGWRRGYSLHTEIGESLQQFKSENNL